LNADSDARRTPIPIEAEHLIQGKPSTLGRVRAEADGGVAAQVSGLSLCGALPSRLAVQTAKQWSRPSTEFTASSE